MACNGCGGKITQLRNDEVVINLAKVMAKEGAKPVGLFRDTTGRLKVAGPGDNAHHYITPPDL